MTSIVCASVGTSLHNLPILQAGACYSETGAGETYKKGASLVNEEHEEKGKHSPEELSDRHTGHLSSFKCSLNPCTF